MLLRHAPSHCLVNGLPCRWVGRSARRLFAVLVSVAVRGGPLLLVSCFLAMPSFLQAGEMALPVASGVELPIETYPGRSGVLLVWLPGEHGLSDGQRRVGKATGRRGIAVWLVDLLGARFLPNVASSLDDYPTADVVEVVRAAARAGGKRVYLLGEGHGAQPALRAAVRLEHSGEGGLLAGVVLLSPYLYASSPQPGSRLSYIPAVEQLHRPVAVLQPQLSSGFFWLGQLTEALDTADAPVLSLTLAGVRDGFYARADATPTDEAMARRLPEILTQTVDLLAAGKSGRRRITASPVASP